MAMVTIEPAGDQPICNSEQRWRAVFDQVNRLADGNVAITVNHIDAAANRASPVQQTVVKDILPSQMAAGNIGVPDNDLYTSGPLDFVVAFDEDVIVNTDDGTPRIAIQVGDDMRYAYYVSGSGTDQLTFRYIVQAGDDDRDGIEIAGGGHSIDFNGGIIEDVVGNPLSATMIAVPDLSGITINGRAPTLSDVVVMVQEGTDDYYRANESVTLTVIFSKPVSITGTPELSLDVGGERRTASYTGGSGASAISHLFTYTIAAGEDDSNGVSVVAINSPTSIIDAAGNNVASELSPLLRIENVIVDTTNPVVTGLEDDLVVKMDKTWSWQCSLGSEDTCYYRFAINGSSSHQFSDNNLYGEGASTSTPGILNGDFYLHVQARDVAGNESQVASASVTLDNTAPQMLDEEVTVPEGRFYVSNESLDFAVRFNDLIFVETVSGTPRLVVAIGNETRYANYFQGEGTTELVFSLCNSSGRL